MSDFSEMDSQKTKEDNRFKGKIYPKHVVEKTTMEVLSAFKTDPEDVLVAGYARSGTTWLRAISGAIWSADDLDKYWERGSRFGMPPMEMAFPQCLRMTRPAVFLTHLCLELLPKSFLEGPNKILFISRNPKDTVVSLYHFYRMNARVDFKGSFDDFFSLFMSDNMPYGNWFSYQHEYHNLNGDHVHKVRYEDLVADPEVEIADIAKFLGKTLGQDKVKAIANHSKFASMKENKRFNNQFVPHFRHDISPFMRKGIVGDWQGQLTAEQSSMIDEACRKLQEETGISYRFS